MAESESKSESLTSEFESESSKIRLESALESESALEYYKFGEKILLWTKQRVISICLSAVQTARNLVS